MHKTAYFYAGSLLLTIGLATVGALAWASGNWFYGLAAGAVIVGCCAPFFALAWFTTRPPRRQVELASLARPVYSSVDGTATQFRQTSGASLGAYHGFTAGLKIAASYAFLINLPWLFVPGLNVLAMVVALLTGVFPAVVLGTVSGIIIGRLVQLWLTALNKFVAALLGLTVAGGLTVGLHVAFRVYPTADPLYWLWVGGPMFFYGLASMWIGYKTYQAMQPQ